METEYFPHFIRSNYPAFEISNESALEIAEEFKKYLLDKFADKPEKLPEIWDISPKTVIPKIGHPFRVNGYHPALILHFKDFCKINAQST